MYIYSGIFRNFSGFFQLEKQFIWIFLGFICYFEHFLDPWEFFQYFWDFCCIFPKSLIISFFGNFCQKHFWVAYVSHQNFPFLESHMTRLHNPHSLFSVTWSLMSAIKISSLENFDQKFPQPIFYFLPSLAPVGIF